MISFIYLTFLSFIKSFQSPRRNQFIEFDTTSEKTIKSTEDSWYFVNFELNPKFDQLTKIGIQISTKNMISNSLYSLFLSPNQVSLLSKSAQLKLINSNEKIINAELINISDYLDIETSMTFTQQDLPKHQNLKIKQIGNSLYRIKSDNNIELSKELSQINKIFCISPSNQSKLANNRISGFTQLNTRNYSILNGNIVFDRPLERKGLNGNETVLLIEDTFLDPKSTFFYDSNFDTIEKNKIYDNHRKIKLIFDALDGSETMGVNEHGTHVSGTALGNSLDSTSSIYNGIAPEAKVAFYTGGSDPHPVYSHVSNIINDTKPCVCTNSWGDIAFEPNVNNEWDSLSLKHNKTLFIFCAGNSGSFIWSPGSAKNILTVGSIDTLPIDLHADEDLTSVRKIFIYNNMKSIELPMKSWSVRDFDNIPQLKSLFENGLKSYKIATINFAPSYYKEKLLFIENKTLIENIDRDNLPDFLIMADDITEVEFNSYSLNKSIPVCCVTPTVYKQILDLSPVYSVYLYANYATYPGVRKASYSSDGPTTIGLMKPDIMAPGTVVFSASSNPNGENDHKDLCIISGTSMATPNVAGATALVTQYFKQGFYRKSLSIEPSSSLLKSILINAADPVSNTLYNTTYGFGVLNLHKYILTNTPDSPNSNTINNDKSNNNDKIINNDKFINNDKLNEVEIDDTGNVLIGDNIEIDNNAHLIAEINVHNQKELRVTMSYLDEPSHPDSFIALLVDLDLVVISPNGTLYRGNQRSDDKEEHYSTNERVIIPQNEVQNGKYQIHIFSYLPENIQKSYFAISIFGSIEYDQDQLDFHKATECIESESGSECDNTKNNICLPEIYGHSCQTYSEIIWISKPDGDKKVINVPAFGVVYLSVLYPYDHNFDKIIFDLISVTELPSVKISYIVDCESRNKSCHVRESNADQILMAKDLHLEINNEGHNENEFLLNIMIYNFAAYDVDMLSLYSFTVPSEESSTVDSGEIESDSSDSNHEDDDSHSPNEGSKHNKLLIAFVSLIVISIVGSVIALIVGLVGCKKKNDDKTEEFKSIKAELI